MKHKIGDRVKVKDLDWYNKNKNSVGHIQCGKESFVEDMSEYCGQIATITEMLKNEYYLNIDDGRWCWTDDMFEGLVEPLSLDNADEYEIAKPLFPSQKIIFGASSPNETELVLGDDFEMREENGVYKVVRKRKEYPKTYEECCKVLGIDARDLEILDNMLDTSEMVYCKNLDRLLNSFRKLLICRDAYWKLYGEEMGLGKPWEPDWTNDNLKHCIRTIRNDIGVFFELNIRCILSFPTEEMRDVFYENFKNEIESCKELL